MATRKVDRPAIGRQASLFDRHADLPAVVRIPIGGRRGEGKFALLDPCDSDLAALSWHLSSAGYAMRHPEPRVNEYLHRVVLERMDAKGADLEGDHINRDTLDNRRENLRWATRQQNLLNRHYPPGETGYRNVGLARRKSGDVFLARLSIAKKQINLGAYPDAEIAARVVDAYAHLYHGEYAVMNFPGEEPWTLAECERVHQEVVKTRRPRQAPPWKRLNVLTGQSHRP